jgi:hypothetical protein
VREIQEMDGVAAIREVVARVAHAAIHRPRQMG